MLAFHQADLGGSFIQGDAHDITLNIANGFSNGNAHNFTSPYCFLSIFSVIHYTEPFRFFWK